MLLHQAVCGICPNFRQQKKPRKKGILKKQRSRQTACHLAAGDRGVPVPWILCWVLACEVQGWGTQWRCREGQLKPESINIEPCHHSLTSMGHRKQYSVPNSSESHSFTSCWVLLHLLMPASPTSQWWESPYWLHLKRQMSLVDTLRGRSTGEFSQLKNEFSPSDTSTPLICGQHLAGFTKFCSWEATPSHTFSPSSSCQTLWSFPKPHGTPTGCASAGTQSNW